MPQYVLHCATGLNRTCACLQVRSFSNRSNEQSLRLTSLDHLGVIAARLRKDAATSIEQDHEELINILAQVLLIRHSFFYQLSSLRGGDIPKI